MEYWVPRLSDQQYGNAAALRNWAEYRLRQLSFNTMAMVADTIIHQPNAWPASSSMTGGISSEDKDIDYDDAAGEELDEDEALKNKEEEVNKEQATKKGSRRARGKKTTAVAAVAAVLFLVLLFRVRANLPRTRHGELDPPPPQASQNTRIALRLLR